MSEVWHGIAAPPRTSGRTPGRSYESPLRRQQVADTRERIVAAGVTLLREHGVWRWRALTVRAVAARAEVNERTVYRHFPNERALREAVLEQLRRDAGVRVDDLAFDDLAEVATRVFSSVSASAGATADGAAVAPVTIAGQQQALLDAVATASDGWDETARLGAAAIVDVLWSTASYGRLVAYWGLAPDEAADTLAWAIGLVQQAIRDGRRPLGEPR